MTVPQQMKKLVQMICPQNSSIALTKPLQQLLKLRQNFQVVLLQNVADSVAASIPSTLI